MAEAPAGGSGRRKWPSGDRSSCDPSAYMEATRWVARNHSSAAERERAAALADLCGSDVSERHLRLVWWSSNSPGNYGDWLSPYILRKISGLPILLRPMDAPSSAPHLVSLGSIGRAVLKGSVVVGTGVLDERTKIDDGATILSVRGPFSARAVSGGGGRRVDSFGDPGAVLRHIFPIDVPKKGNGKIALVRHFAEAGFPLELPDRVEELSVLRSRPADIEDFITRLASYDGVLTSAMHVAITCHSYGIPCRLITLRGAEGAIDGSGVKYLDYAAGVGIEPLKPLSVPMDLRIVDLDGLMEHRTISDEKVREIVDVLELGIDHCLSLSV